MRILIIHQVPYRKVHYRRGLDHERHDVTYIGHPGRMADLPSDLRSRRIVLEPDEDIVAGITARVRREDGYEHVIALSEFGVVEACLVRDHLGLPGPAVADAERVRDKVKMKEAVAAAGVRAPRFVAAPGGTLPWSGRTVVKPRQGASAEGVAVHASTEAAIAAYRALDDPTAFELEEYVDGDMHCADGNVDGGKVTGFSISRYVNTPLDFIDGVPYGAFHVADAERHRDFVQSVVTALGIREGSIHLEFFLTPLDEPVFLEIANRVGGAGLIDAHLRHTGVHLPSQEIAIRLGLPMPEPDAPSGKYHGWLAFPGHHLAPETQLRASVPGHLRHNTCVDKLHELAPGDALPDHVTYQEWLVPLFFEASHADSDELAGFLRECARSVVMTEVSG
ncbi:MAG TPA: hypothetical protein VM677_30375 [Actinokineospora sp.]|nr:hypothetical protein [Actinokineospora sp.]